jgi:hypothetical protein
MNKLYVTGGKQRKSTLGVNEWNQYECGNILQIDPSNRQVLHSHQYTTPAQYRPDQANASILFKSGSINDSRLYVCTQTEVLIYQIPDFQLEHHISLPCFNDLHHVAPTNRDTLLVASTGLDLILELTLTGEVINEWFTSEESGWHRFSQNTDYRKVVSTKPHASHPNFVFEYENQIWSTRFEQKDAFCLTNKSTICIGTERPHDGHVYNNLCFFTTVDGHIIIADLTRQSVIRRYNLSEFSPTPDLLGWCRGLHVIDKNNVIVAFSRIRPTKFHQNLLWVKQQLKGQSKAESKPTRIAHYDLANKVVNWELDLEPFELNAIFSVLPG